MKQPKNDREYKNFADDFKTINYKINFYGENMFKGNKIDIYKNAIANSLYYLKLDEKDFNRLIEFSLYDYRFKNRSGAEILEKTNLVKDFKLNNFLKLAILLSSEEVSEKSKNLIMELLKTDSYYPYSNIVHEATVQGMYSSFVGLEENTSFEKTLERKLELSKQINKVCDQSKSPFSSKNLVRAMSSRLMFPPKATEDDIEKATNILLNEFDKMSTFFQTKVDGSEEIRDNFFKCYQDFMDKTNQVSNIETTKSLFTKLAEIRLEIKELKASSNVNAIAI